MNFSITISLVRSSAAAAQAGTIIVSPERPLEEFSWSSYAELHLMDFTVALDLMAQKEQEEKEKNKTKSSLMTKEI